MTLRRYFRYADAAREERPLYLFDPKFAEKVPELDSDYQAPVYFREDLFALLGRERPDYRWVIIGPAGSGSSFHVDTNSTSAWNAVVSGSKRLVMFSPEVVPPGVHPSLDGAEGGVSRLHHGVVHELLRAVQDLEEETCRVQLLGRRGRFLCPMVGAIWSSISRTPLPSPKTTRNLLNVLDFLRKPNASELVSASPEPKIGSIYTTNLGVPLMLLSLGLLTALNLKTKREPLRRKSCHSGNRVLMLMLEDSECWHQVYLKISQQLSCIVSCLPDVS